MNYFLNKILDSWVIATLIALTLHIVVPVLRPRFRLVSILIFLCLVFAVCERPVCIVDHYCLSYYNYMFEPDLHFSLISCK